MPLFPKVLIRDSSLASDTVDIVGRDTTIGFSRNVGHPAMTSSAIVRLLQDAGAIIHVKTTVPSGLLSLETVSDLFGRTTNPYDQERTSGASTGGGASLVASGGSKIEIGSDVAGSVRIPAHWCGIWSLKGSVGRFPTWGSVSSMQGLEGIQIVTAPLAASLADLDEFWKRVVMAEPWRYDHTVCVHLFAKADPQHRDFPVLSNSVEISQSSRRWPEIEMGFTSGRW